MGELLRAPDEIGHFADWIRSLGPEAVLAWDTETGASEHMRSIFKKAELHPYVSCYITGLSLCVVEHPGAALEPVYVPIGHLRGNTGRTALRGLLRAMNVTQATQLTHHSLFDWAVLKQLGLGYRPPDGSPRNRRPNLDTQIVRWLQDENAGQRLKEDLGILIGEDPDAEKLALAEARKSPYKTQTDAYRVVRSAFPELPVSKAREWARTLKRDRSWAMLTVEEMTPYAARDASLTFEVAEHLLQGDVPFQGWGQPKFATALTREHVVNGILFRMTERGVSASVEELDAAFVKYNTLAEEIGAGLKQEFGIDNPNSSKQVTQLLYRTLRLPVMGTTPKGAPATDKNALEMLQGHPVAARVLEYRKWHHAATSYARSFADHARYSSDGRIHGHFSSTRTVTGRLSASGPNVMTIPRDDSLPEIRHAFFETAPGVKRYGFDLSSAELWVTASITRDPLLTTTLQEGRNLHAETMVQVFGGDYDKTRREYTLSKNVNFGIEYGAGLDQITIFAAKAGYSPREARSVAKKMRDGHKRAFETQHRMADFYAKYAEREGKLPLMPVGRYRHFVSPGQWIKFYTALNALVQGGVAELVKDIMIGIDGSWARDMLVLQVHDEMAFDAPDEPGMEERLLALLTNITNDVNPFRYPMRWAAKKWE